MLVDGKTALVYTPADPEYAAWSFSRVMIGKYPFYQLRYRGEKTGSRIGGLAEAKAALEREGRNTYELPVVPAGTDGATREGENRNRME
jgi:hypothetical protein